MNKDLHVCFSMGWVHHCVIEGKEAFIFNSKMKHNSSFLDCTSSRSINIKNHLHLLLCATPISASFWWVSTNMKRTGGIFHSQYAKEGHMLSLLLMKPASYSQPPPPLALWKIPIFAWRAHCTRASRAKFWPSLQPANRLRVICKRTFLNSRSLKSMKNKWLCFKKKPRMSQFTFLSSAGDSVDNNTEFCKTFVSLFTYC